MSYYPPYRSSSNNIKVELDIDLSNYATKDDVKKVEDKVDENKKEIIFVRGFFLYKCCFFLFCFLYKHKNYTKK